MIGVIAKLPVKEGKVDEAINMIKEFMVHLTEEEGTLLYTINSNKSHPNTIVIMERYKDKAALDHHASTPHFKEFFRDIAGLLAGKPEIKVMEEIHSIS